MTHQHLTDVLNAIINQYTNQRVGFAPGVDIGQCPAPVCYFLQGLGCPTPPMYGDRADGWGVSFPGELTPFFTHEVFQPGKAYPEGTILMWNSPHIALVISSNGSNVAKVFEQNADPDGAPCHVQNRLVNAATHTCTYALVPIVTEVAPVVTVAPEQWLQVVKTIPGYNTANEAANHLNKVTDVVAQDYVVFNRADGMLNVTEHPGNPGWWINPTDNVAVPIVVTPALSAATAAPVQVPKVVVVYDVGATLLGYATATDAGNDTNAKTSVAPGTYYVWSTYPHKGWLKNVTKDSTLKTPGSWIDCRANPSDPTYYVAPPLPAALPASEVTVTKTVNVANIGTPPTVNDWRETYKPLLLSRKPLKYRVNVPIVVHDLATQRPDLPARKNQPIDIYGTFTSNGVLYGRPKTEQDPGNGQPTFWYGIPMRLLTYQGTVVEKILTTLHITKQEEADVATFLDDIIPFKKWIKKK